MTKQTAVRPVHQILKIHVLQGRPDIAEFAEKNLRNFTIFSQNTSCANITKCDNIAEIAEIFLRFMLQITFWAP